MAANLDKSLGEIIGSRKTSSRGGRRKTPGRAPAGGVAKNAAKAKAPPKANLASAKAAAAAAAAAAVSAASKGNKKILVSGLPTDATEKHIKDYFSQRVGPISRIELNYGPTGVSRGVANIIFRENVAQKAVTEHNGVLVDGKPMKVEVVYDAKHIPTQPEKTLGDRVSQPKGAAAAKKDKPKKDQPKAVKADDKATARGGKRGARAPGRRKKKTQEELDAEMVDYFDVKAANGDGAASAAAAAAAAPATGAPAATAPAAGGEAMDEIL